MTDPKLLVHSDSAQEIIEYLGQAFAEKDLNGIMEFLKACRVAVDVEVEAVGGRELFLMEIQPQSELRAS